jgi:hypothetical protein
LIKPPAMPGGAEKAVVDVVTENASDGKMKKVSQTEIIKPRRRSEWTIPVYHTQDGNASTT